LSILDARSLSPVFDGLSAESHSGNPATNVRPDGRYLLRHDGMTEPTDVAHLGYSGSDWAARRLRDVASRVAGAAPPTAGLGWNGDSVASADTGASATPTQHMTMLLVRRRPFVQTCHAVVRSAGPDEARRGHTPSNKGMELTRPGGGEHGVGALQLIPGVRWTDWRSTERIHGPGAARGVPHQFGRTSSLFGIRAPADPAAAHATFRHFIGKTRQLMRTSGKSG
jgi:hypothetical protein